MDGGKRVRFSALQRAEIAETNGRSPRRAATSRFSALQRAEIAETEARVGEDRREDAFQCSSTSRNC